ncbi:hypothetical protein MG293_000366 [Ovis ammon polii]|uniref:Uncharacterized protein n=1 Tax=Ovis ammon polii TaxID=230172 RepID=A0AAD4YIE6_OVIAM|nr:hypothetical protein MG293_000366 [Ovis ammon polii]
MLKIRRGGSEEIPLIQGKEQWLRFPGAAVKRYPTSKVRETQDDTGSIGRGYIISLCGPYSSLNWLDCGMHRNGVCCLLLERTPLFLPRTMDGFPLLPISPITAFIVVVYGHFAAAVAKSLQSCPTPCDPIDGSPPGSPIPGILQARTLEWVAISFSNAGK